jgi:SecD/SecF fusion protein
MQSFAFTMLFGVALGTFSSIYIAAPVLIIFRLRRETSDEDGSGIDMKSGTPAV